MIILEHTVQYIKQNILQCPNDNILQWIRDESANSINRKISLYLLSESTRKYEKYLNSKGLHPRYSDFEFVLYSEILKMKHGDIVKILKLLLSPYFHIHTTSENINAPNIILKPNQNNDFNDVYIGVNIASPKTCNSAIEKCISNMQSTFFSKVHGNIHLRECLIFPSFRFLSLILMSEKETMYPLQYLNEFNIGYVELKPFVKNSGYDMLNKHNNYHIESTKTPAIRFVIGDFYWKAEDGNAESKHNKKRKVGSRR